MKNYLRFRRTSAIAQAARPFPIRHGRKNKTGETTKGSKLFLENGCRHDLMSDFGAISDAQNVTQKLTYIFLT